MLEVRTRQLGLRGDWLKLFVFGVVEVRGDLFFGDSDTGAAVVGELAGFDEVVNGGGGAVESLGDFLDFEEGHSSGPFRDG